MLFLRYATVSSPLWWAPTASSSRLPPSILQIRSRGDLAPRRIKYRKAFKGNVPIRIGGSIKGTTLEVGEYGMRVKEPVRLSAKILKSCETAIKKAIKSVKEAQCYIRVFPHIPVCIKGNETRMGKGKGSFEYWACRAPVGTVLFEVGGGGIQREVALNALRIAQTKIPVTTELIDRSTPARLGSILIEKPGRSRELSGQSEVEVELERLLEGVKNLRVGDVPAPFPETPIA